KICQSFAMGGQRFSFPQAVPEQKQVQIALCRDSWVELPERTGSRISRIRKEGFPIFFAHFIKRFKRMMGHICFPAHFYRSFFRDDKRHASDRAQIARDVLPHLSISPRGTAHETSVLIQERNSKPVNFKFANVDDLFILAKSVHYPAMKVAQFLLIECIAET